jgi:DNA processing protein
MSEDVLHLLALSLIPNVGSHTAKILVSYCGSAEKVFTMPIGRLTKIPKIGEKIIDSIKNFKLDALQKAEEQIKLCEKTNSEILVYYGKDYPTRLKNLVESPLVLFVRGKINFENQKVLSIVGTRNATEYGRNFVNELVEDLKVYNPLIVSGLAYGIDIFAHKAALQNDLQTVGVMASGLQTVYPPAHSSIAEKMLQQGGLVTEYIFGTKPDAPRFPDRNRIIAGLADAILVVEAKEKGGALITANLGFQYEREVLAVPGNVNSRTSAGCNNLIKANKATMVTNAADLVSALNWDVEIKAKTHNIDLADFSEDEISVITLLREKNSVMIDDIAILTQIPINHVAVILLGLEFKNIVQPQAGKKYKINSDLV